MNLWTRMFLYYANSVKRTLSDDHPVGVHLHVTHLEAACRNNCRFEPGLADELHGEARAPFQSCPLGVAYKLDVPINSTVYKLEKNVNQLRSRMLLPGLRRLPLLNSDGFSTTSCRRISSASAIDGWGGAPSAMKKTIVAYGCSYGKRKDECRFKTANDLHHYERAAYFGGWSSTMLRMFGDCIGLRRACQPCAKENLNPKQKCHASFPTHAEPREETVFSSLTHSNN